MLWRGYRDFLNDQHLLLFRHLETEPDAESGEQQGNESTVNLERVFQDEKPILNQPEHNDQHSATQTVDQRMNERLFFHVGKISFRSPSPKKLVDTPPALS